MPGSEASSAPAADTALNALFYIKNFDSPSAGTRLVLLKAAPLECQGMKDRQLAREPMMAIGTNLSALWILIANG